MTILRPTDGVDVYFEKPADDTEHANFLRAKTDLEERRLKRINEVTFLRTGKIDASASEMGVGRWNVRHIYFRSELRLVLNAS